MARPIAKADQLNDATLANYLGNFVHGFDDATQRRHLRKRGWIAYVHKSWNLTEIGKAEAIVRGFVKTAGAT